MKQLDPIVWLLKLVLHGVLTAKLDNSERVFVHENIQKHRVILWISLICAVITCLGLRTFDGEIGNLITALIAPVMVAGAAWFSISFGAIPQRLIACSISITFWMFLGFMVSLSAMLVAVSYISPILLWPVYGIIYLGVVISAIQYDTSDGLKIGLDETMLKHSRAALIHFAKEGIDPDKQTLESD